MKITSTLLTITAFLLLNGGAFAKEQSDENIAFLNSKPASKSLPFSEAVRVGNTVYLSGKIGFDAKSGKLIEGGFEAQANQTMTNIKNSLNKYGYEMNDVVKCMVMLADINDFKQFNQIYTRYFSPPYPARSAFAVKQLVLNASVEVECIAAVDK